MRWFKVETLRQDEWLKIVTEIYVCMLVTLDMVNHYFHSVCFILCVCYVVQNKKFAFNKFAHFYILGRFSKDWKGWILKTCNNSRVLKHTCIFWTLSEKRKKAGIVNLPYLKGSCRSHLHCGQTSEEISRWVRMRNEGLQEEYSQLSAEGGKGI